MSSTIENKVVKVSFDHKDFDKGLDESKKELEKYEKKLKMDDGVKALSAFQKSLNAIDLSGFSKSINAIEGRLSTFGIMGAEITRKVTDSMISAVTNLYATTMGQIKSGGKARATNIEQAHFLLQGLLGDEEKVQEIMDVAMDSVDGTAYGFDQAAKAAAQFVASGLTADELVTPLKAVAGVAATTSSDYSALANIFTKIAGQGRAMTGELNQLSSYGINAAATLAEYFNGVSDGTIQVSKEVQNEINGAWAKAEVSDKVKDMLGEGGKMTEGAIRELASQSAITFRIFSDALGQRFGEHAKKANETVSGAMANAKASLSRIGAEFYSPLIEQNGPLVKMFNSLRVAINVAKKDLEAFFADILPIAEKVIGLVTSIADVESGKVYLELDRMMGSINDIAWSLTGVFSQLKEAFTSVFGDYSFVDFLNTIGWYVNRVTRFILGLTVASDEASLARAKLVDNEGGHLVGFFKLIFGIIKQFKTVVVNGFTFAKQVVTLFGNALENVFGGLDGVYDEILSIAEGIAIFSNNLKMSDEQGEKTQKIFEIILTVLKGVMGAVKLIIPYAAKLFVALQPLFDVLADIFITIMDGIFGFDLASKGASGLTSVLDKLIAGVSTAAQFIHDLYFALKEGDLDLVKEKFKSLGEAIFEGLGSVKDSLLSKIPDNGIFGGIIDYLKNTEISIGGVKDAITSFFDTLSNHIPVLQDIKDMFSEMFGLGKSNLFDKIREMGGGKAGKPDDSNMNEYGGGIMQMVQGKFEEIGENARNNTMVGSFTTTILGEPQDFSRLVSEYEDPFNKIIVLINSLAGAITSLRLATGVGNALTGVGNFLTGIGKTAQTFSGGLKNFLNPFADVAKKKVAMDGIFKIIAAISALIFSFALLVKVASQDLDAFTRVSAVILILVGVLLFAMVKLSKAKTSITKVTAAATAMKKMAEVIAIISASLIAIMEVMAYTDAGMGELIGAVVAIGLVLAIMVGLTIWLIKNSKDDPTKAVTLIQSMTVMLIVVGAALAILSLMDPLSVIGAAGGLALVILILGIVLLMLVGISKEANIAQVETVGKLFERMANVLAVVALSLWLLAKRDPEKITAAAIAIAGLMILIAGVFLVLGKFVNPASMEAFATAFLAVGGALLLLSIGILVIVQALTMLMLLTKVFKLGDMLKTLGGFLAVIAGFLLVIGLIAYAFGGPILLLGQGFFLLGAGLFLVALAVKTLAKGIIMFIGALAVLAGASAIIGPGIAALGTLLTGMAAALADAVMIFLKEILKGVFDMIYEILTFIENAIPMVCNILLLLMEAVFAVIIGFILYLVESGEAYSAGYALVGFIIEFLSGMIDALADRVEMLADAITKLIVAILATIGLVLRKLGSIIKDVVMEAVKHVKKALGINSPSKVFFQIGKFILLGLWNGLKLIWKLIVKAAKAVWRAVKKAFFAVVDWFKSLPEKVANAIKSFFEWVAGIVAGIATKIGEGLANGLQAIKDWIVDKAGDLKQAGTDFIGNIIEGFTNFVEDPVGTIKNIWEDIKEVLGGVKDWISEHVTDAIDSVAGAIAGVADDLGLIDLEDGETGTEKATRLYGKTWGQNRGVFESWVETPEKLAKAYNTGLKNNNQYLLNLVNDYEKAVSEMTDEQKAKLGITFETAEDAAAVYIDDWVNQTMDHWYTEKKGTEIADGIINSVSASDEKKEELKQKVIDLSNGIGVEGGQTSGDAIYGSMIKWFEDNYHTNYEEAKRKTDGLFSELGMNYGAVIASSIQTGIDQSPNPTVTLDTVINTEAVGTSLREAIGLSGLSIFDPTFGMANPALWPSNNKTTVNNNTNLVLSQTNNGTGVISAPEAMRKGTQTLLTKNDWFQTRNTSNNVNSGGELVSVFK